VVEKQDILNQIGTNLKEFRNSKQMSTQELADITNISKSTVVRIENGKLNPTIVMLHRICNTLTINVSDLVKGV